MLYMCINSDVNIQLYIIYNLEVRDKYRRTVLHSACWRGSLDVVKYLVEELGCDVGKIMHYVFLYEWTNVHMHRSWRSYAKDPTEYCTSPWGAVGA